jgi:hypothetical protein
VLAVTVKSARTASVVPKLITLDRVVVPEPKFIDLAFVLELDAISPAVTLYELKFRLPLVSVIDSVPMFKALPKLQPQSTPLTLIALASVTPFVVNVSPVELLDSVIAPVYVLVSPVAGSVTLPCIPTIAVVPASVTFPVAGPAIVSDFMRIPPLTVPTVAV